MALPGAVFDEPKSRREEGRACHCGGKDGGKYNPENYRDAKRIHPYIEAGCLKYGCKNMDVCQPIADAEKQERAIAAAKAKAEK